MPYSNDMAQFHRKPGSKYRFRLPLMRGTRVIEWEPDQRLLTRRTTEQAIAFIEEHRDQPFFVYLPHSMPHVPLAASAAFEGRSSHGLYGDVIEEIDWSVGEIVAALERLDLTGDTLVVFTSDNGPWLTQGLAGGCAGPLRGGKGTNWEGGQRVPCVAAWPGTVPAGRVCREVVTAMDLMPTIVALAGVEVPTERPIDGRDASALLLGHGPAPPAEPFLYYSAQGELAGAARAVEALARRQPAVPARTRRGRALERRRPARRARAGARGARAQDGRTDHAGGASAWKGGSNAVRPRQGSLGLDGLDQGRRPVRIVIWV